MKRQKIHKLGKTKINRFIESYVQTPLGRSPKIKADLAIKILEKIIVEAGCEHNGYTYAFERLTAGAVRRFRVLRWKLRVHSDRIEVLYDSEETLEDSGMLDNDDKKWFNFVIEALIRTANLLLDRKEIYDRTSGTKML